MELSNQTIADRIKGQLGPGVYNEEVVKRLLSTYIPYSTCAQKEDHNKWKREQIINQIKSQT